MGKCSVLQHFNLQNNRDLEYWNKKIQHSGNKNADIIKMYM